MDKLKQKPKILVVDDKLENLYTLQKLLQKLEVEIIETTTGFDALKLVLEHDFSLAIVDVQMPEMDGYELVELLRSSESTETLPVIFVSAIYSDEYHHRKGYEAGAVDFLSKPFIPEILLSKVKVFLDLYRQRVNLNESNQNLQQANTMLFKRALELETTNRVGRHATSILELEQLLPEIVSLIQAMFNYYVVGIWLLNEEKDRLVLQANRSSKDTPLFEPGFVLTLHTTTSIIVSAYKAKQRYLANDVKVDPQYLAVPELPQTHSEIALPLQVGSEVMGVLDIQSDQLNAFDRDSEVVLQTLASQIAIAIRNARLYKLEKKLNADKDKFFSIISHDLRGPFNSLLGNAELMVEMINQLSRQDIEEMSQSIHNRAKAAHNLLENLLTWSQLQQGRIEYEPGPVALRRLAEDTVALLHGMAQDKQIRLEQTIDGGVFIHADKCMIDTVIRNLTSNALKFTPVGGQVTLSARPNGASSNNEEPEWIEVSISDTGVGISQEDIDKLFKIEVHHTTRGTVKEKGTGLGLILCQEMVEKNGGRIWVESVPGQGTAVRFTIPAATSIGSF